MGVSLTEADLADVRNAFMAEIASSRKGKDRTEEQNRRISDSDARLMVALLKVNGQQQQGRSFILGRRAYVVSASSRYIQVDRRLGLGAKLNARPQVLAALIDLVSDQRLDDAAFVKLFENPILADAVDAIWPDVKGLLDAGVALSGANIVRLRYDLTREAARTHFSVASSGGADNEAIAEPSVPRSAQAG